MLYCTVMQCNAMQCNVMYVYKLDIFFIFDLLNMKCSCSVDIDLFLWKRLSSFLFSRSCPARCGPEHPFRGAPVLCFGRGAKITGESRKSCIVQPTGMGSL